MHDAADHAPEDPALRLLMARYQGGSLDAFDRLHDALAPDLRAYLAALCRNDARAEDLVQETFLQMHRARAAHTPGEPVRPWVFAIARRVFLMDCRAAARRAIRERAVAEQPRTVDGIDERVHARRQVESALMQASPEGRRAFMLHHLIGWSFKEIAVRSGITTGAAKIRSSRAAAAMRAWLRRKRDD